MSEIRRWLEAIDLGQYADAFEINDIDMDLIRQIDDQALRDLGMTSAGHRLRIRNALAKLTAAPAAEVNASVTIPTHETVAASAERRQLTVMFCDLVGSTALSTRLDPEDLREIIGAYHRHCAEAIVKYGGFVARYMGDGVLAYFGYPQAHEDDAERAVRAGLTLVGVVTKRDAGSGMALHVRVGIATGKVVVGDLTPGDPAHECEVVGETPNLAARLQTLAEPDAVVIDSNTHRLLGHLFEYRMLGPLSVKGFDGPLTVWQVTRVSAVDSRFEALRATTTPLVGRGEEIDLLLRRWDQAKRGEGCVVLISGEPGIGKSRIAQTVAERINAEPHTRLRYFCSPHHQDSALYPSIAQLERAAGFRREDTSEQCLAKLEAVLSQGTNDLSEVVPLFADLLSIPTGDRYLPLNLTPQKRKQKTLHAQLAQVEALATRQPVLMVFEDAHWSDPTTRESLDLVVDRVAALRVLVIITFRPEFTPSWIGRPHVTLLALARLPIRQRAQMITHVTGGKMLPKEIADQIVDRTDGVPLFIEELTKSIIESGLLIETGNSYAITGPVLPLTIPTTLHASLLARLDRLSPTREVAQIGAALGRSFSHELISAVAPMSQPQLNDALAQLVNAELIFRRGEPPDAEYTFKHALVQDAAYGTLLRSRRQQLHAHIAAKLEARFPEIAASEPAVLARHCAEAGLVEKAIVYRLKAGRRAMARSAMTEAVAQFQKGLDLLAGIPDGPRRREEELNLQIALGPALAWTKGHSAPEVGEAISRARALAEQLDQSKYLAPLLYGQWQYHLVRSEHKVALSIAEYMDKVGEERNDQSLQLLGRRARGLSCWYLGKFVTARALQEQCFGLGDPTRRAVVSGLTEDPFAAMLATLAITLAFLGYIDQARSRLNEALLEARQLKHAQTLAVALSFASSIGWIIRSPELQRHAEELLTLSAEHDFPLFFGFGAISRGRSFTALGQAHEGLKLITQGLSSIRSTGSAANMPRALMCLAEAYAAIGRPLEGLGRLAEAVEIIERTEERNSEAELYQLRGDLLNATGDRPAAEESYRQALAVANRQSAKTFELRAATSLARLWRDQGKRTEARGLLAPIYGWFTEGLDTPILQDAKALLDELV
jgi:class 3 adenylate cyclase